MKYSIKGMSFSLKVPDCNVTCELDIDEFEFEAPMEEVLQQVQVLMAQLPTILESIGS